MPHKTKAQLGRVFLKSAAPEQPSEEIPLHEIGAAVRRHFAKWTPKAMAEDKLSTFVRVSENILKLAGDSAPQKNSARETIFHAKAALNSARNSDTWAAVESAMRAALSYRETVDSPWVEIGHEKRKLSPMLAEKIQIVARVLRIPKSKLRGRSYCYHADEMLKVAGLRGFKNEHSFTEWKRENRAALERLSQGDSP